MKLKVQEHPTENISFSLLNKRWWQDSFSLIFPYLWAFSLCEKRIKKVKKGADRSVIRQKLSKQSRGLKR